MTERIQELAQEAWRQVDCSKIRGRHPAFIKFFSELLIQDCLDKISGLIVEETFDTTETDTEWNQALGTAALEIQLNFFGDTHE